MTSPAPGRPKADTPPRGGDAAGVSRARKIGLFGGSFDPVHNAHLALAHCALDELELDELLWVPVGDAWQKPRGLTTAEHRVAMLKAAIAGEPRFALETCEIDRSGPSYTLDTVRELQLRQPGASWWLLIGQDQQTNLHTWHCFEELLQRVTLAVAARPGTTPHADARVLASPTQWIDLPPMAVSASDIRQRVATGQDIAALVPPCVAQYIHQHRLYAGRTGS